jgi:hypothetical protein
VDTPNPVKDQEFVGPPPVRTLLFSMLSLLVEVSAAHVGAAVPSDGATSAAADSDARDLREARLAIDAANALLAAVGRALSSDERLAIEGLLTQLQVEYVKRSGA